MIKHEMATPDDLVELFQYLSDLHRREIANFCEITGLGWADFQNAIAAWADKTGAWTLRDELGRVLAVWGSRPTGGKTSIFMLCTRAFFDKTGTNLREVKRLLARQRQPGEMITVVTYSRHPKARRWAHFLGFNHAVEDGGGVRFTLA